MSTTSGRVVAATVAAIIAVLTGITVGMLNPRVVCRTPAATATATAAAGQPAATTPAGAEPSGRAGGPSRIAMPGERQPPKEPASGVGGSGNATSTNPPAGNAALAGAAGAAPEVCTRGGFAAVPALVGLMGALAAGGAVFGLLLLVVADRRRGGAPGAPRAPGAATPIPTPTPTPASPVTVPDPSAARTEADRAALVQACIYVRDRTTSKALAERLGMALHDVGVTAIEPAGARFDPAQHEAGGAMPSDDPAKIGTIAAVEVPGYVDRGQLLRAPVVTVYQAGDGRRARREDR